MSHPSDAEVLSHITTYEPPPSGFDPLSASHQLLRKHGFPHRPDPDKEPRLSKLWRDSLSRPLQMIKAELEVDHSRARDSRLRSKQASFGLGGQWAGAQVNTSSLGFAPTELANIVYGEWNVPTVKYPKDDPSGFAVGFWVGLDGDFENDSSQVIQAGTEAISDGSSVIYRAWTQWPPYQPNAVVIKSFPVAPGDRVGVLVTMPKPDHSFISIANYTNGYATSLGITISGAVNDGTSAEWVIEGNGPLLADFSSVLFAQCMGGTKDHDFDLTDAFTRQIYAPDGVTALASGYIIASSTVESVWDRSSGP